MDCIFKIAQLMKGMTMYILKNFGLKKSECDPYLAPERRPNVMSGVVYGHPKFPDGKRIETSSIKEVEGRIIRTYSGSEYRLYGRPHKLFLKWMREKGISYDSKNPLKGLEQYLHLQ